MLKAEARPRSKMALLVAAGFDPLPTRSSKAYRNRLPLLPAVDAVKAWAWPVTPREAMAAAIANFRLRFITRAPLW